MSFTVVYIPKPTHKCEMPERASHGTIIQCDECGQYWRYKVHYSGSSWIGATETTVDSARKGLLA